MQIVTHPSVDSCPRVTPKGDATIVDKWLCKNDRLVTVYAYKKYFVNEKNI